MDCSIEGIAHSAQRWTQSAWRWGQDFLMPYNKSPGGYAVATLQANNIDPGR
jgi:hypothetical protein